MPIELNDTKYELALLDTGVISELLKNRNEERLALTRLMIGRPMIPCISIWSVLELREREDLYQLFIELFSVVPFILVRDPINLLEDEIANYPDPSSVEPVAFAFSMFNPDPEADLNVFMAKLFSHPEVKKSEGAWGSGWKRESLDAMLALKANFQPSGDSYSAKDAELFVELAAPQYVTSQAPNWVKGLISQGKTPKPEAFPSVKMALYTVFYRFYAEQREPEEQDVFDILIGNIAPYLDGVITENFQAEIYRKVKNRDPFLYHLSIDTVSMLR
jgi:hypothetical protein